MSDHKIVTGAEARNLPLGSVILLDSADPGSLYIEHPLAITNTPFLDWWDNMSDTATFRVLHVPEQPPTPVEVGHVFNTPLTHREIDTLPLGSVLIDGDRDVAVLQSHGWVVSGDDETYAPGVLIGYLTLPITVLKVGDN